MRTPPASLHRRRAHRLHSEGRAHRRVVEAGAHRRRLFAPPAGARTIDHSDRRTALSRRSAAERRDGGDRGGPPLYDDAWSQKGRRHDHHLGCARRLQKRRTHAHRGDVVFDREQAWLMMRMEDRGLKIEDQGSKENRLSPIIYHLSSILDPRTSILDPPLPTQPMPCLLRK